MKGEVYPLFTKELLQYPVNLHFSEIKFRTKISTKLKQSHATLAKAASLYHYHTTQLNSNNYLHC